MNGIAGKVAVVTGGSSGIGLETARVLCRAGAKVLIAARNPERGESVVRVLREEGGEVLFVPTDVSRSEDVRRLVATALERWGRLDLAVNNAALMDFKPQPLVDIPEEEFERHFAVDVKGTWLCLKHEIPAMLRTGGGAIVNVSSVNGLSGTPTIAAYCAAKHAIHGLSKTAAMEYAGQGIRVNVLCPGAHYTPALRNLFEALSPGAPDKADAAYRARIPQGRVGEPVESARAIAWLLSSDASYVNGTVMTVDGGLSAGG
jgi:NAD(P)-dependent dehydrogenase (short-subunit alcohol dehydrogenase family)